MRLNRIIVALVIIIIIVMIVAYVSKSDPNKKPKDESQDIAGQNPQTGSKPSWIPQSWHDLYNQWISGNETTPLTGDEWWMPDSDAPPADDPWWMPPEPEGQGGVDIGGGDIFGMDEEEDKPWWMP